ncbi:MAG: ATPase, T2SS/T4P/T4SS family [Alphaproteobacteria bacterium]|nr:ATPase, T2SS/T4P/T4SS family [Alphaproteobacteria bacterium]
MAQILPFPDDTPQRPLRVGEKLLQSNSITPDQLQIALHEQRRTGRLLGTILVQLGFLEEDNLAAVLAERTGLRSIDLKNKNTDPALMQKLPKAVAQRCRAVPVSLNATALEIAMADPYDVVAMDEIRRYFPRSIDIIPLVAAATDIAEAIEHYGCFTTSLDGILNELETGGADTPDTGSWQHPVVRLVDTIIFDAVKRGASDIHLEPESSFVRLRYRIDGVMQQIRALHREHWPELSHRLKIMAGMNIADTRSLQDGRFRMQAGGADIDFRMAVMPTAQGENIVIRILDHRCALLSLEKLGFHGSSLAQLDLMLERPEGIILVTGPTGCGKTTSLYAMLRKISSVDVNIMTLEEPVEYQFNLIRQTAVQEEHGLGFAEGVRGILRQDPDIIFIGEVRDADTAQMALRAAMTGHQVFSTLHCNDALGALPRLVDLGLHPRMMAGHISGIVAQRLARKLCTQCIIMRPATEDERRILRCDEAVPYPLAQAVGFAEAQSPYLAPVSQALMIGEAVGCEACNKTGYRGRVAVAEVLRVTPQLDELVAADQPRSALRKQASAEGFRSMIDDGIGKVLAGEISLDSLRRAVDMTRPE